MIRDVLGSEPGTSSETLVVLVSGAPLAQKENCFESLYQKVLLVWSGLKQLSNFFVLGELTDKNKSLVFDTTASNSGVHKCAAKLPEEKLQR